MRRLRWIFLGVVIAAVAMWLMGGNELPDPRKLNWPKYTDVQDGYSVSIPPKWSVLIGKFQGYRGIRIFPQDKYPRDLAGFIYGLVLARTMTDEYASAVEFVPESMLVELTQGVWMEDIEIRKKMGYFQGKSAEMFLLHGVSSYAGYRLRGSAVFVRDGLTAYLLFFTATEITWADMRDSYILIRDSFRFP